MQTTFQFLVRSNRVSKFLIVFGLVLVATEAMAGGQKPIIRDNDEMGNYEIAYGQECSDKCKLEASTDFGSTWTAITGWMYPPGIPNYVVTDKPDGTYHYRIRDVEIDWEEQEQILSFSPPSEVVVGPVSQPPTLEEQLAYDYEIRVGDINADGLQDIFVDRVTAAPANNGTIRSVLLEQTAVGVFETLVPNTAQINTASSWPLTAIDVIAADANLDGFADLRLDGVGNVISGVHDQLVYSPAVAYTEITRNVRAIDPNFEAFAQDIISYYLDDDFFTNSATTVYEQGEWDEEYDCELDWRGIQGWEWVCRIEYVWEPGGWITSYPGINGSAVSIWEDAVSADAGQGSWQGVADTLARVFGVDIQIGPWCIRVGGVLVGDDCTNAGLAASIVGLFTLFKHEDSPRMRVPNRIYITGHRLAFIPVLPKHIALEFQGLTDLVPSTVSAYNSEGFSATGTLLADENRTEDQWFNNVSYGFVTSSNVGEFDHVYFQRILDASAFYEAHNCLPYQAWPVIPGEGYNSNGYASSLIDFTGGIATTFWAGWGPPFGWDTQLDFAWFTSSPPPCPP